MRRGPDGEKILFSETQLTSLTKDPEPLIAELAENALAWRTMYETFVEYAAELGVGRYFIDWCGNKAAAEKAKRA